MMDIFLFINQGKFKKWLLNQEVIWWNIFGTSFRQGDSDKEKLN